jgi:hypothetical protein
VTAFSRESASLRDYSKGDDVLRQDKEPIAVEQSTRERHVGDLT